MNGQKVIGFGITTLALTLGLATNAPKAVRASDCFNLGPVVLCPSSGNDVSVKPTPKVTYVVTETNPFTGGRVGTRSFQDQQQAQRYADSSRRAHWAEWKYAGIGEQMHRRRFNSHNEAQAFLAANPCPNPIFCVIEHKRVVATNVSMTRR